MRNDPDKIEEKLIPYLEGVLNPKERREIDEAINSNGELAREMSELREMILELRQGFANGMRPPQEELTVEEVVELGANPGTVETMPGSSQQKARLFCSDDALEEYSLLRALQEEMARTTLDRENVPEMPETVLKEFRALKALPGSRKVLSFDKKKLSPVPLWRRASLMLDRIDPKPLMASAAALMMLSLGVHFYNKPAGSMAPNAEKEIGFNFSDDKQVASTASPALSPTPGKPGEGKDAAGVAVFTSDDRSLLKEQAEKLMSNKVRYTVTKDRILVAEKDIEEARGILWADSDGKVVAMGSEKKTSASNKAAGSGGGAAVASSGPDSNASSGYNDNGGSANNVPIVNADNALAQESSNPPPVTYYDSRPSRQDAPARPVPPRTPVRTARAEAPAYTSSAKRDPAAELERGMGMAVRSPSAPAYDSQSGPPPRPSDVDLSGVYATGSTSRDEGSALPPEPTRVDTRSKASEARPPMSEARRQKLKEMALGADRSNGEKGEVPDLEDAAPAPSAQAQTTTTMNRGRVAAAPPAAVTATAPVPNAVSAPVTAPIEEASESKEEAQADGRMAKMETSRQAVAQRNAVELSFESRGGKVSVYVRPKKTLSKAELDALRKTLRKELGLSDSDTIIIR